MSSEIWTFFYGSFMNPEVMSRVGHVAAQWEVSYVSGFEFSVAPRASLRAAPGRCAFGIATPMTHAKLDAMYATQSHGETYLPRAMLASDLSGKLRPVMCYIVANMAPGAVDADYVRMISEPARQYGFPEWYVRHIESFIPAA